MADSHASPAQPMGPLTVDAFVADRQQIWASFTSMVRMGAIGVAIILILMAIFLV